MKRLVVIAAVILLSPVLVPRLSGIGYEEAANGAQAWAYVRQGPLRIPDLMSILTEEDLKEDGEALQKAASVLVADSLGPATLAELLAALNQAKMGFQLLENYYPIAIARGKTRQEEQDKKVGQALDLRDKAARILQWTPSEAELEQRKQDSLRRIERAQNDLNTREYDTSSMYGSNQLYWDQDTVRRNQAEIAKIEEDGKRRSFASEAYPAAAAAAQTVFTEAENTRRYVIEAEAHLPVITARQEDRAKFHEEVCKRVRLMTWKEPMAKEYPELGTEALHPRYVVGNACVFAKHAQEPWLRRYAIEQLAHWKAFYPEAQATLESIRDDESDAFASFAGEQLAGNK